MSKIVFTTSWDDGSVLDLKVADLLSRHDVKGTFYIPNNFDGRRGKFSCYDRRLSNVEIKSLSSHYEIGAHSVTHRVFPNLSPEEVRHELSGNKNFLEELTGFPTKMFCFPGGKFNDDIIKEVKSVGFIGGRTTKKLSISKPSDFLMDVTVACQPYPFRRIDSGHYYWRHLFDPIKIYQPIVLSSSWLSLAKKLFSKALIKGNYFHLYGHSWELEKYDMWSDLEKFLIFVKSHKDIEFLSNGDIIEKYAHFANH